MKYSRKGQKDRNRHKNRIKRSGQAWLGFFQRHKTATSPPREGEPVGTLRESGGARSLFGRILGQGGSLLKMIKVSTSKDWGPCEEIAGSTVMLSDSAIKQPVWSPARFGFEWLSGSRNNYRSHKNPARTDKVIPIYPRPIPPHPTPPHPTPPTTICHYSNFVMKRNKPFVLLCS